jgi:transcriptional regulator with XRE-family HTH domain
MNLNDRHVLPEIRHRVREPRTARGLTQAALAERCEPHRTFVGSVERGERNVSILNLRVIARALRVPLTKLLSAMK